MLRLLATRSLLVAGFALVAVSAIRGQLLAVQVGLLTALVAALKLKVDRLEDEVLILRIGQLFNQPDADKDGEQ